MKDQLTHQSQLSQIRINHNMVAFYKQHKISRQVQLFNVKKIEKAPNAKPVPNTMTIVTSPKNIGDNNNYYTTGVDIFELFQQTCCDMQNQQIKNNNKQLQQIQENCDIRFSKKGFY